MFVVFILGNSGSSHVGVQGIFNGALQREVTSPLELRPDQVPERVLTVRVLRR